jgi:hypothetical protein
LFNKGNNWARSAGVSAWAANGWANTPEIFLVFVQFPVRARDNANGFGSGLVTGHELLHMLRNGFSHGCFIGTGLEYRRFTMYQGAHALVIVRAGIQVVK